MATEAKLGGTATIIVATETSTMEAMEARIAETEDE
jgi:hypothetical protein